MQFAVAAVCNVRSTGDNVPIGKDTVKQLNFQTGRRIAQRNSQGLRLFFAGESRRQAGQIIFPAFDLMLSITQISAVQTVLGPQLYRAQTKISAIGTAVFLRQRIQRPAAILTHLIRIR